MNVIKVSFMVALSILFCYQIAISIYLKPPISQHSNNLISQTKLILASVYCRPQNVSILNDPYFDQTIVMLKSALISAHLYNISTLEIHLFLEHHQDDQSYFQKEVLNQIAIPGVSVILQVHSAVDKVPSQFINHMIYHPRFRCGYVRLYIPQALLDVDSIIYLDSDIVVTGNLLEHWKLLSKMDSNQLIAVGRDSPEANKLYFKTYDDFFKRAPHVQPRGINSGLLVMNLTRMRKFKIPEKLTRAYEDYSKVTDELSNQRVLNILLYYNPGLMLEMPCNLHFMGPECEHDEFYCQPALQDPDGVHVVHGTDHRFMEGGVFSPIYNIYKKFNVSTLSKSGAVTGLMREIKLVYSKSSGKSTIKCSGTLGEVLFKRFLKFKLVFPLLIPK